MNAMKNEIELRLIGSLLSEWCKQKALADEKLIYRSGLDSTHRVIRFTTPVLQSLFTQPNAAMYEIRNTASGVSLSCAISSAGLSAREHKRLKQLANACVGAEKDGLYTLVEWDISAEAVSVNALTIVLEQVFECERAWFESQLSAWQNDPVYILRPFPQDEYAPLQTDNLPDELYLEGAQKEILTNRYERNPKARARCIAVQGSACKVCGFDFGAVYGEAFAGKIEVHHIKPISEIGEEYLVDPVRDLLPVCPNCHRMLHSKPDGVFSIEELKMLTQGTASDQK